LALTKHEIGLRLKQLSFILDKHPEILSIIRNDLVVKSIKPVGRSGLSVESVFRCLILKQLRIDSTVVASNIAPPSDSQMLNDCLRASKDNVLKGRTLGIQHVVFHKRIGISYLAMGVKRKTFEHLRNFRAGVEGNISELKRAFGVSKATWKSHDSFKAFV